MANDIEFEDLDDSFDGESEDIDIEFGQEDDFDLRGLEDNIPFGEVEPDEEILVDLDMAFPPVGGFGDGSNHTLLSNRDANDQHPIKAITGLQAELDNIKALKTIYADSTGMADYFLWADGNPSAQKRLGMFVALCQNEREIEVYDGTSNILGVTVDQAGFIGGQGEIPRDSSYALVQYSGEVHVLCDSNIYPGDCVVPNSDGVAQLSNSGFGYKVVNVRTDGQSIYAVIILDAQIQQLDEIVSSVNEVNARLDNDEVNITSAVTTANMAKMSIDDINLRVDSNTVAVNGAVNTANSAKTMAQDFGVRVNDAIATANTAKNIANSAVSEAQYLGSEAINTANQSMQDVLELTHKIEPIDKWQYIDPETGEEKHGAEYFVQYVDEGVATKIEMIEAEDALNKSISAIKKSADVLNSTISNLKTYSLGRYSQSYGLYDKDQANEILSNGMVYVPYDPSNQAGTYRHKEQYLNDPDLGYWFSQGYYYTWSDSVGEYGWNESASQYVVFSSTYVEPSVNIHYWVTTADVVIGEGIVYDIDSLYAWSGSDWIKVASLADEQNGRMISSLKQEVNSVSAEIANAAGSYTSLSERLTGQDSTINMMASWRNNINESMASIGLTADDVGASISQIVTNVGSDGEVNAASIITSINNDTSLISLKADKIDLRGAVTANNYFHIKEDGTMQAKDAEIIGTFSAGTDTKGLRFDYDGFTTFNGYTNWTFDDFETDWQADEPEYVQQNQTIRSSFIMKGRNDLESQFENILSLGYSQDNVWYEPKDGAAWGDWWNQFSFDRKVAMASSKRIYISGEEDDRRSVRGAKNTINRRYDNIKTSCGIDIGGAYGNTSPAISIDLNADIYERVYAKPSYWNTEYDKYYVRDQQGHISPNVSSYWDSKNEYMRISNIPYVAGARGKISLYNGAGFKLEPFGATVADADRIVSVNLYETGNSDGLNENKTNIHDEIVVDGYVYVNFVYEDAEGRPVTDVQGEEGDQKVRYFKVSNLECYEDSDLRRLMYRVRAGTQGYYIQNAAEEGRTLHLDYTGTPSDNANMCFSLAGKKCFEGSSVGGTLHGDWNIINSDSGGMAKLHVHDAFYAYDNGPSASSRQWGGDLYGTWTYNGVPIATNDQITSLTSKITALTTRVTNLEKKVK